MNTPKQNLPEQTPAETIAAFTYSLSRQEALYGQEPLNVERVINRMAQAIQKAIDAEVARICETNGIDKLLAKITRLEAVNATLLDKLNRSNCEAAERRREVQREKARELKRESRERLKADEMPVRVFEHPAILAPTAKAE